MLSVRVVSFCRIRSPPQRADNGPPGSWVQTKTRYNTRNPEYHQVPSALLPPRSIRDTQSPRLPFGPNCAWTGVLRTNCLCAAHSISADSGPARQGSRAAEAASRALGQGRGATSIRTQNTRSTRSLPRSKDPGPSTTHETATSLTAPHRISPVFSPPSPAGQRRDGRAGHPRARQRVQAGSVGGLPWVGGSVRHPEGGWHTSCRSVCFRSGFAGPGFAFGLGFMQARRRRNTPRLNPARVTYPSLPQLFGAASENAAGAALHAGGAHAQAPPHHTQRTNACPRRCCVACRSAVYPRRKHARSPTLRRP